MRRFFVLLLITVTGCASTWAASITASLGGANYLCQQSVDPTNCPPDPSFQQGHGDYVGESVLGSGLSSVDSISLSLSYLDSLAVGMSETYDVLINGTRVGSFLIDGADDAIAHSLSGAFSFTPITGPDYTVLFEIASATIPPGSGSLGWYHDDVSFPSTFILSSTAVPEPADVPVLGVLFGITAVLSRRTIRARS